MVQGDLQKTDQLIVDIVNKKLKITHVDSIFNFPIFKSAKELTFAIVDGSNNMRSIYIINTKWWSDFQTKTRQFIVKELNTQKRDNKIHLFWTFDGRIFAKKDANGRKQLIP
jgi:hypothetical protein